MGDSVSASVVLFNTDTAEIDRCLDCLTASGVSEICIVDHSDSALIRNTYIGKKKITYYWDPGNPGYGAGHNRAFKLLKGNTDFHLVLNSDVTFAASVVPTLIDSLQRNSTAALAVPQLIRNNGDAHETAKLLPRPIDMARRLLPFLAKVKIGKQLNIECWESETIICPYASGCFMLFDSTVFKKMGGFDERYFLYPEDIDISRRVFDSGHLVVATRRCEVTHAHRAESKRSLYLFFVHLVNMAKYFNKWGWFIDRRRSEINRLAGKAGTKHGS